MWGDADADGLAGTVGKLSLGPMEGEVTARTRYAKADAAAMDSSRNAVIVRGPLDYVTQCDALCSGKPMGSRSWTDMMVGDFGLKIREAIEKVLQWPTPFPVQQAVLPLAKLRRKADGAGAVTGCMAPHIIAQAENGAGKTGAFCLASILALGRKPGSELRAIIITTTSELAQQAAETVSQLTCKLDPEDRPVVKAFLSGREGRDLDGRRSQRPHRV